MRLLLPASLALAHLSAACSGSSYYSQPYRSFESTTYAAPAPAVNPGYGMPGGLAYGFEGEMLSQQAGSQVSDVVAVSESLPARSITRRSQASRSEASGPAGGFAMADTSTPAPPSTPGATPPEADSNVATDAAAEEDAQLLIYTANITLAIYDVQQIQERIIATITDAGGYAAYRDQSRLTLRVPAESFHELLDSVASAGDVLGMSWAAEEVSEQFRDLDIRLRNALDMRDRLAVLLEQATSVGDALAIEEQLQRLTLEIELYRGQLRSLMDRVSFSTITVLFQQIQQGTVPTQEYLLPFPWLNTVGLEWLLAL
jgi:hypothetical protein